MKVALISCCSIRYMPYIELHKHILNKLGIEYIIISDHEVNEPLQENHFAYQAPKQRSKIGKIKRFFGWRRYVKTILKREKVERIVLLTTWPGVKFVDEWTRKYKNKYILDIRDFTSEGQKWYGRCVNHLIKNSHLTIVSSERFKTWLIDSEKINVIHNMPVEYQEKNYPTLKPQMPYSIGYVGLVNYETQNKALVNAFSQNSNITLFYKGTIEKSCHIKEYCEKNCISNVIFTGRYDNSQKGLLYDDIDMINAIYGNNSLVVTTALPNKLYDCIIYKKPLIASKGTYLGELIEKYNLGITVDTDKDDIFNIINYYVQKFDAEKFIVGCKDLMDCAIKEHKSTTQKMEDFYQTL